MLSAKVTETPRPRPPAKIRRSTSLLKAATPPPSYSSSAFASTPEGQPRLDTLLGSPMPAVFQKVGWENDAGRRRPSTPAAEEDVEWTNEKSREELSDLLVKADDLIKERENEIGLASAVCRGLYENNVALKTKHEALLARLPSSPSPSPEPLSRTSSRYSISLSQPVSEFDSSAVPSSYKAHARKISVSTAEISHLADQNAELLDKLEKLESESFSADQSGRRVLKRLEKEISTLREELEKTQAKSEELEEKTKTGYGWDSERVAEEVWRKKKEREAKFRAMRNIGRDYDDGEEDTEVRNFAPEGSPFGGPSSGFSFFHHGESPRVLSSTPINRSTFPQQPTAQATAQPESLLISQLMVKIQELEDTNSRIIEQQTETTNQLNAMQRETEHINRLYECFGDENHIELDNTSEDGDRASRDDTIRFKSFKRNLGYQIPRAALGVDKGSTSHALDASTISKTRKSVMGLFDSATLEAGIKNSKSDERKNLGLPIPFSSPSSDGCRHSSRSMGSNHLASPALSSLSLTSSQSQAANPFEGPRRTLETELGQEFNDAWGLNAGNHHLRSSSLCDLSQLSVPPSPSPSPSHMSHNRSRRGSDAPLPTPMSIGHGALRLSVEPPTPDKVVAPRNDQGGSAGSQSARYHHMSQTIRSRTSRWVDGRFSDTLTGGIKTPAARVDEGRREVSRPSTPLPQRLADALDAAVESFTGQTKVPDPPSPVSSDEADTSHGVDATGGRHTNDTSEKPRGLGAFMLELWLWLQFAVIMLVFLWAMAKRGPKSVLGEAGQGRATSTRR